MNTSLARQACRFQTWSLGVLFLLLMAVIPAVFAQIITSSVTGFVTDPSGAVIPEARVTIKQVETGFTRTAATSNQGEYRVIGIPAGTYTLTVEKSGFQTILKSNQAITQQLAARINFVMHVGSVRQTVTVQSAAPLLQTETPTNAVTLSERQITQLPTLGGSYLALAILSPGALPTVSGSILNVVEGQSLTGGASWKPVSIDASGGPPAVRFRWP